MALGPNDYVALAERFHTVFLADVPRMKEWWVITDPMQVPFATRKPGEWWADMENVFHTD